MISLSYRKGYQIGEIDWLVDGSVRICFTFKERVGVKNYYTPVVEKMLNKIAEK